MLRAAAAAAARSPTAPAELTGPSAATLLAGRARARGRSHATARGRAAGRADRGPRPRRRLRRPPAGEHAGRGLAGQRRRPLRARVDQHPAPLDPNFTGAGFCVTDAEGRYRFVTIKPGAYPWKNHPNAWRPAHIHFSLFGHAFTQRLVTQMYFPGDPLLEYDPIVRSIPNLRARERLVAQFDWSATVPEWALGYRFDVTLGGRADGEGKDPVNDPRSPSQTVGPFFGFALPWPRAPPSPPGARRRPGSRPPAGRPRRSGQRRPHRDLGAARLRPLRHRSRRALRRRHPQTGADRRRARRRPRPICWSRSSRAV